MRLELYPHQASAVAKLSTGSILVGGVGTGKSRTALAYFYTKVCGGKISGLFGAKEFSKVLNKKKLYIITTARKRDTLEWEDECTPFLLSSVDAEASQCPVTIDSWNNIKKYKDVAGAFFIFDEQRLVGTGAWVKTFLKIAKVNDWILLTATPGDVWLDYAPVFIANGFYRNITEFRTRHVVYHRYAKFPKVERYVDVGRLEKLRDAIVVPMKFEKKAAQNHIWIKVPYDDTLYSRVAKDRWNVFESLPIRNKAELCYVLRKIVNSDSKRLTKLNDIFSEHPKLIVFYNFDYELAYLRHFSEVTGAVSAEWNGHKHEPLPDTDRWLYLVQYTAGAEGWNCVETDTVVFFSQNYSYRTMTQAAGRIDRMNTPYETLYFYHLFSDSSIDKSIKACLMKKKNFNEKLFEA